MTQAKHTPGPWAVRETATHVTVVGANGEALFHDDKRIPMVLDDARLIAAAPKIYELLKRYYQETPLGNQTHMIAHEVEQLLSQIEGV